MNVSVIRNEMARRLATVVADSYSELPANPVFPCAIVGMPVVRAFHFEYGHDITRCECEIRVFVGRGDLADTQDQLGQYVSTDTGVSVLQALEDETATDAWLRLKVVATSDLITDANALGVSFFTEIDS